MKPSLHFVELNQVPIFQQLQWEEALLRADNRNWCIMNKGSPRAIVMGISGVIQQWIQREKFQRAPLPLIRRFSGGGTVIVDENTIFMTLICQSQDVPVSPFPRSLLQWMGEIYRPLFLSHPFEIQENDYVIGRRKWGGNAQAITKGRWLHHSSLLWDYHPESMDYLLMPPKMPSYRQGRPHTDFLCRLCEYWPNVHSFQMQLVEQLNKHFVFVEQDKSEIERVTQLPHRKMTCLIT